LAQANCLNQVRPGLMVSNARTLGDATAGIDEEETFGTIGVCTLGFGCAAAFAYMICEKAPCHESPRSERWFFILLASCVLSMSCFVYFGLSGTRLSLDLWTRSEDVTFIFVLFMQLFVSSSSVRLSGFNGPDPAFRPRAAEHLGNAIIMAMAEVTTPVLSLPGFGAAPPLLRNMLPFLILILLLRLSLHPSGTMNGFIRSVLWSASSFVVLIWLLTSLRYCCRKQRARKLLLRLVWQMIDEHAMRYVLPMLHCPKLIEMIGDSAEIDKFSSAAEIQAGTVGKAIVIDALAKNGLAWGWVGRGRVRQLAVVRLVLSAEGRHLTKLKNCLDMGGGVFNTLYIFGQLSLANRERLLMHISLEAAKVRVSVQGRERLKVLSDIDDTLYSSGGKFPAGCDHRWPRRRFYPGVFAFYRGLDRCHLDTGRSVAQSLLLLPRRKPAASDELGSPKTTRSPALSLQRLQSRCNIVVQESVSIIGPSNVPLQVRELWRATSGLQTASAERAVRFDLHQVDECNLVFLSARPHLHKDLAEAASYKVFWNLVHAQRVHTVPSLLPGSLWAVLRALLCARCSRRAWRGVGQRKFNKFFTYSRLYPEYRYIFVGDNGQGDLLAAEMMVQALPEVLGCFIHEVQPISRTLTSLEKPDRVAWAAKRIFFFRTYVGAAIAAFNEQLINVEALAEVVVEAIEDYRVDMHKHGLRHFRGTDRSLSPSVGSLFHELVADATRANDIMKMHGLPAVELPDASEECTWEGTNVYDGCDTGSEDNIEISRCMKEERSQSREERDVVGFQLPSLVGAAALPGVDLL